jgi:hypothetical protein
MPQVPVIGSSRYNFLPELVDNLVNALLFLLLYHDADNQNFSWQ